MTIDELEITPLHRYSQAGNDIQVCATKYRNICITLRTVFWWNIFKDPTESIIVDLILPNNTIIENGSIENYYEPEGFGSPVFRKLEDAVLFIDKYLTSNK